VKKTGKGYLPGFMKKIAQGAEAIIYEDKARIVKFRKKKRYRLPELDSFLRKSRTRRTMEKRQK